MILRPPDMGKFQFVVLATLRAAQLMRGCRPRIEGIHKPIMIAQFEIAEGKVKQMSEESIAAEDSTDAGAALVEPAGLAV